MTQDDYRSSHLDKGEDYDAIFRDDPHTAMLWSMEQVALKGIVERYFGASKPRHLDFACGTGRITALLSGRTSESLGVDVSENMLNVARANCPTAEFLVADITESDALVGQQFDLITAFRFFPNAQPSLRLEAMQQLSLLLAPGGIMVFNDHLNSNSLHNRTLRMTGRAPRHGMSLDEVRTLVRSGDLVVDEYIGIGYLPMVPNVFARVPGAYERAERWLTQSAVSAANASNVLVVARHAI